jgi:hypothetical protein
MNKLMATTMLAATLIFAGTMAAQQTNEQARQDAAAKANMDQHASKQQKKAAKAQENADHKREKALNTGEAKDAAKAQDKADSQAVKADQNPR